MIPEAKNIIKISNLRQGNVLQDLVNHILQEINSKHNPLTLEKEEVTEVNSYNKKFYKLLIRPVDQIIKENFVFK